MKIGDRVRWKSGKPADSPEHNGKITAQSEHGFHHWSVRFDDGTEEWCNEEDLEVVDE